MGKRINRDKSGEMARPQCSSNRSLTEMSCILLSRSCYFRSPCTLRGIKADYGLTNQAHQHEHKQFEIMCALAVVGQVNDADLGDLKLHIAGCVACQSRISDFAQISAQALPLSGEKYGNQRYPKAMIARFVERTRAEGVPLGGSGQTLPSELLIQSLGWKGNLAAAQLLIMIIASGVSKFVHSRAQSADTAGAAQTQWFLAATADPSGDPIFGQALPRPNRS
jgi:hypothetical protein